MPTTNYFTMDGVLVGEETDNAPHIAYIPDALGSVVQCVDQNGNTTYTARQRPLVLSQEEYLKERREQQR